MNKKIALLVLGIIIITAAACRKDYFSTSENIDLSVPVSFSEKIQPIFTEDCSTTGCHKTGVQSPDLSAGSSYDQLTQLGYVDTTNAEGSLLYKMITSTTKPMPPTGRLSNTEIGLILTWIKQGAQNN